jgi:hypothetical protein
MTTDVLTLPSRTSARRALLEQFADVPAIMKRARRWLVRRDKVPFYVDGTWRRGTLDSADDIARLGSFRSAVRRLLKGGFDGLGFALGPDGKECWQGIDMDDLPGRPELHPLAEALPGYTERSPSGRGMHAIGYGRAFATLHANGTGLEAYSSGRFFTVTGDGSGLHEPCDLADFVEQRLRPTHARGRSAPFATSPAAAAGPSGTGSTTAAMPLQPSAEYIDDKAVTELRDALNAIPSDGRETWIKVGMALKTLGNPGRGLWLTWSQTSVKYDPADAVRTWDSFKPMQTDFKAVFAEAARHGWVNPLSNSARRLAPSAHLEPGEPKPPALPQGMFIAVEDLVRDPAPVQYLIDELFEHPSLAMLFGKPSAGKSFIAISWAASIACGHPWAGRDTKQGSVFYLAGEGHAGLSRRLKAWSISTGQSLAGAPLLVSRMPAALMDAQCAAALEQTISALCEEHGPPALIVVDTLARNMGGGDENSNAEIGIFVSHIDRIRHTLGCTVLIVHHSGHLEGDRARGGSALPAAMDAVFKVEDAKGVRKLVQTKAKESELAEPMNLVLRTVPIGWLDSKGREITSAVIDLSEGDQPAASESTLSPVQFLALDTFCQAAAEQGDGAADLVFTDPDVWRSYFYERHQAANTDTKRKAFSRACKDLVDRGRLEEKAGTFWIAGDDPAMVAANLMFRMSRTA